MAIEMIDRKYGDGGVVSTEHPAIVDGINNMIKNGYSKDAIVRIIGAPPEVVESLQRRAGHIEESHKRAKKRLREQRAAPVLDEAKRQAMIERMAKARAARKPNVGKSPSE
jgi:hypothetical protein